MSPHVRRSSSINSPELLLGKVLSSTLSRYVAERDPRLTRLFLTPSILNWIGQPTHVVVHTRPRANLNDSLQIAGVTQGVLDDHLAELLLLVVPFLTIKN